MALSAAGCDHAWPIDGGDARSLFGLSLCAGAGGLDLGLHIAIPGYRTVGYVERESYAAATLVARMEDAALDCAPVWDDVATFDGRPWRGLVDIIHGGYPCQPFSIAGRKLGDKDPRHLWPYIARIVREVEPRLCFFENVGGHLRLGFEQVHDDLRSMGFRVKAGLFTAEEVGAPHRRERLFILAYRDGDGCECHPRAATGKDDPQGRAQCSANTVAGGNGDAAEGLSLYETGFGAVKDGTPLSRGESALADATGTGTRQQRPDPRSGAEASGDPAMGNTARLQRRKIERPQPHGDHASMGDAHGTGLEGRDADQQQSPDPQQPFPPGPTDRCGWEKFLRARPDLEPAVRGGADGLAFRVDRLRLCGNGVVPLVAAYAFRTLAAAANIEFYGS
ncbi:MAG: DNA cytosine methyltransferase [Dongiaceae bacterium]